MQLYGNLLRPSLEHRCCIWGNFPSVRFLEAVKRKAVCLILSLTFIHNADLVDIRIYYPSLPVFSRIGELCASTLSMVKEYSYCTRILCCSFQTQGRPVCTAVLLFYGWFLVFPGLFIVPAFKRQEFHHLLDKTNSPYCFLYFIPWPTSTWVNLPYATCQFHIKVYMCV